jgi:hypothetical protein
MCISTTVQRSFIEPNFGKRIPGLDTPLTIDH